jgi:uncharacterized coiled-coil DUF342 family protein
MSNSTYCDDHYEQPLWRKKIEEQKEQIKQLTKERDELGNEVMRLRAKLREYGCEL